MVMKTPRVRRDRHRLPTYTRRTNGVRRKGHHGPNYLATPRFWQCGQW
ncbi:hypothetical protein NY08_1743 [Rhodococcus sp. B7740]|nr:hypothetical protein NY08_1743 [Rhodococcus sp. B7740]